MPYAMRMLRTHATVADHSRSEAKGKCQFGEIHKSSRAGHHADPAQREKCSPMTPEAAASGESSSGSADSGKTGRYRPLLQLDAGGMADVYLALASGPAGVE